MHTFRFGVPIVGLALILAACSTGSTASSAAPAATAPAATAATSTDDYNRAGASPETAAGAVSVSLADTSLGKVLVGDKGMTLYIFTPDTGGKSVCNDDCAAKWPPLAGGSAPTLGSDLDAEDFTTITRDDGSAQVAFYGLPLYYFAGDTKPGDTAGQGLGDKWYVVGADGTPIK